MIPTASRPLHGSTPPAALALRNAPPAAYAPHGLVAAPARAGAPAGVAVRHAAEFVLPGHPDRLCDAIADALVAEAHGRERRALVAVEVAAYRASVFITGFIGCLGAESIDVARVAREAYASAGYDDTWGPAPSRLQVHLDLRREALPPGESEARTVSDDQVLCIGHASGLAATQHLPVEHWLVGRLARALHALRTLHPSLALGPDGKVAVVLREERCGAAPAWTLESLTCSLQQRGNAGLLELHRAVRTALAQELEACARRLPGLSPALPEALHVNGAGSFEVGGPTADNGLSGKKLVVDAYGPRVPIGGGAWSGKDFWKADRAGALHARRLAKAAVRLGLASEATVRLAWFPGDSRGRLLGATAEGGCPLELGPLAEAFDLSLERSGTQFAGCDLQQLARWGHFTDPSLPWERLESL